MHFTRFGKRPRGNPFRFQRLRTPTRVSSIAVGFLGVSSAVLLYWLFMTSAFAIEKIGIQGTPALPHDAIARAVRMQLEGRRWGIVSQYNIFAFDKKALGSVLTEEFLLDNVQIKKDRPHTVQITISGRPLEAVWSSRGQYFALDAQGVVLGPIEAAAARTRTLIFYDQSGGVPTIKDRVMTAEAMAFIHQLLQNENIQALRPQFITVEKQNAANFSLKVGEGWRIHFDAAAPLSDQIQNLELTLRNTIAPDSRSKIDYIDLRFGERVYYKLMGE